MSLTSFSFFVFLIVTLLVYYLIKPLQKYTLFVASVFFYIAISTSSTLKMCLLIIYMFAVTYVGAILIEKSKGKLKPVVLALSIVALVSALFILKYAFNIFSVIKAVFSLQCDVSFLHFVSIIGISYYALSAIGYLVDVYWGLCEAEKNPANVGLFIFYFPQLISGPLTRYNDMKPQFDMKTALSYDNISQGMRRMVWGYFKKFVISERFAVVVTYAYGHYTDYSFVGILGATLCYAIRLYTDFSGCMDIIMGASKMFGIELPENFNAPFFSETIQEFWQRWHISLGVWFKNYVMYPLQKTRFLQKIGKKAKKTFGKKFGKKIPFYLSMIVLWFLIGIWHGATGYYFIASAIIPCVLLLLSDIFQPAFKKAVVSLKIDTQCESWHYFRRIRTLLLVCICWFVVCSNGTHAALSISKHMLADLWNYTPFATAMGKIGLDVLDILIMTIGCVLLFISDRYCYKGTTIFKKMDEQNFFVKVIFICLELMAIMFFGMVGTSSFIYFQF